MDMRINDINVVADLDGVNPNGPTAYDGTNMGHVDSVTDDSLSSQSRTLAVTALEGGASSQKPWWTGPWPVLHVPASVEVETAIMIYVVAIDIVLSIVLESACLVFPLENDVSDAEISALTVGAFQGLVDAWGGQLGVLALALRLGLIGLETAASYIWWSGPVFAMLAAIYAGWFLLFSGWVYCVMYAVDQGYILPITAAAMFFAFATSMLAFVMNGLAPACRTAKEWLGLYQFATNRIWKSTCLALLIFTVLSIIVKLAVFLACTFLFLSYLVIHIQRYGW